MRRLLLLFVLVYSSEYGVGAVGDLLGKALVESAKRDSKSKLNDLYFCDSLLKA